MDPWQHAHPWRALPNSHAWVSTFEVLNGWGDDVPQEGSLAPRLLVSWVPPARQTQLQLAMQLLLGLNRPRPCIWSNRGGPMAACTPLEIPS